LFTKTAHISIIEAIADGMQQSGNNKYYLELGVLKAACLNRISAYFNGCTGVDINDVSKYVITRNVETFTCNTEEFFKRNTKKYNLIFIDACHKYENVLYDFQHSWDILEPNGLIIMHDTYSPSPEYDEHCMDAHMINKYLYANTRFDRQFITLPFFYGLTIVRRVK
jgi:hypothetical protein